MSSKLGPIVVFEGNGWNLTLQELMFSILIVGVMSLIGFFVAGDIEERVNASHLKYSQAVALNSDSEFSHALATDVGLVFARGRLTADEPAKIGCLEGEWLWVYVEHQRYQSHTRVVAYAVPNGKGGTTTRYRTETYWSWDTISHTCTHSPTVTYCGVRFPFAKFDYSRAPCETSRHSTGWHKRDIVHVRPASFVATVFAEAKGRDLAGRVILLTTIPIEAYREQLTTSHAVLVFWIVWGLIVGGTVAAFYVIENDWLDD